MIVECPACATRFEADDGLLAAHPRARLRCGICRTVFRPDLESLSDPVELALEEDIRRWSRRDDPDDETVEPLPAGLMPQPEPAEPLPVLPVRLRFWATWLAMLLVLAVLAVLARGPLSRLWPPLHLAFETIGLPVPLPGEGLILTPSGPARWDEASGAYLIDLVIENTQPEGLYVPLLAIELRDAEDRPMPLDPGGATEEPVLRWVAPLDEERRLAGTASGPENSRRVYTDVRITPRDGPVPGGRIEIGFIDGS